jgi:hypothetical protein
VVQALLARCIAPGFIAPKRRIKSVCMIFLAIYYDAQFNDCSAASLIEQCEMQKTIDQAISVAEIKGSMSIKIFLPRCLCFRVVSLHFIRKWVRNSMHGERREIFIT